jgi:hypothetical protein
MAIVRDTHQTEDLRASIVLGEVMTTAGLDNTIRELLHPRQIEGRGLRGAAPPTYPRRQAMADTLFHIHLATGRTDESAHLGIIQAISTFQATAAAMANHDPARIDGRGIPTSALGVHLGTLGTLEMGTPRNVQTATETSGVTEIDPEIRGTLGTTDVMIGLGPRAQAQIVVIGIAIGTGTSTGVEQSDDGASHNMRFI